MAPSVDSATRSTQSGLLKNVYEGKTVDQVANPSALIAELEKTDRDVIEGAKVIMGLRMNLSQASGARAELGTLPLPQRTRVVQTEFNLAYLYGVIRISGPLWKAASREPAAFARAVDVEVKGMRDALKLDQARQAFGDGTGALATCKGNAASLTIDLADDTNMLYFEVGMMVDITDSAGVNLSNGASREIESMVTTAGAKSITLVSGGGNVTPTATSLVVKEDSYNVEMKGALAICGTTTFQNVNPATAGNERWKATVDTTFGAWDKIKFQEYLDLIFTASGEHPNRIYSQGKVRNAYLRELQQQQRLVAQGGDAAVKLKGGFTGLSYTGGQREAVWVFDAFVQTDQDVYTLNLDHVEMRQPAEFQFMEQGGEAWFPDILGSSAVDAYKAVLYKYAQIVTAKRNAHGRLKCTG